MDSYNEKTNETLINEYACVNVNVILELNQ